MRRRLVLPLFLILLGAQAASAQPGKVFPADFAATLMPEKTIAFAELYKAGQLAKEIGDLFSGSALGDMPDSLVKIRSKYAKELKGGRFGHDREVMGITGMFLAPEMIAELSRLHGGAVAFTGLAKGPPQMPEFLAVILPGQSNAPGYFMRTMLTMAPLEKIETVEDVSIYGFTEFGFRGGAAPPKEGKGKPPLGPIDAAKMDTARVQVKTLQNAVEAYTIQHKDAPMSLDDLLVGKDGNVPVLKKGFSLNDPWGKRYQYNPNGKNGPEIWCDSPFGRIPERPFDGRPEEFKGKGRVAAEQGVSTEEAAEEAFINGLPVFAMTPGVFFIGSQHNVKEGILRLKGKLKTPSLASTAAFKEARLILEGKPGLFTYTNPQAVVELVENIPLGGLGPTINQLVPGWRDAVNPKAFRAMAQSYTLEKGKLTMKEVVLLNPMEKSPILDVLPAKPVNQDLLQFAPKDAVFAAILDNSGGEQRLGKFVGLVDALTPKEFRGEKFSDHIKDVEKELGIQFGKDLFGQVAAAGIAIGDPLKARIKHVTIIDPKYHSISSTPEIPILVIVQATNAQAADNLMKLVPKMFDGFWGQKITQTTKTIDGREITILKLERHEDGQEICFGREGTVIVGGLYPESVAASLNAGAKKQGLLSVPAAAARVMEMPGRQAIALLKPAQAIAGLVFMEFGAARYSDFRPEAIPNKAAKDDRAPAKETEKPKVKDQPKKREVKITYTYPKDDPMVKEMGEILASGEYLIIGLLHTKEKLQLDGSIGGLQPLITKLVDFGIEEMYRQQIRDNRFWEERNRREKEERDRFEKRRLEEERKQKKLEESRPK